MNDCTKSVIRIWLGVVIVGCLFLLPKSVLALEVVVSIKPLHSLASVVMSGVGEPKVLIQGVASPHTYTLRPSEARFLARADLVFWGGEALETFLVRALTNLAPKANKVSLLNLEGLTLLPVRSGGAWEEEEEEGHHHHSQAGDQSHLPMDTHVWLDPHNAKVIGLFMAKILAEMDPLNAAAYQANAATLSARLDQLDQQLQQELASLRNVHYVVFHDAYHYFENRYGLGTVGSVVVHPDRMPGMRRIQEIGQRIRSSGAVCLFTEPQFSVRLAETVATSSQVRLGVLDPLGADLPSGVDHYFQLLSGLSRSLVACLQP